MKFFIVFQPSGDVIDLETDKPDLLNYYISWLEQRQANKFHLLPDSTFGKPEQLHQTLKDFNSSIMGQLLSFDCPEDSLDLLDQDLLNQLHCRWVHSNHKQFRIADLRQTHSDFQHLFDQISDDIDIVILSQICYKYNLQELYSAINLQIHQVESIFNKLNFQAEFDRDWAWIETKNIFPKTYTSNSIANFSLSFNHYGRHLYNKFCTFDNYLEHDDENTFDQLLGYVQLSMVPSETIAYSPQYLAWCERNKREPGGSVLNIGNIIDLEENLFEYRKLLYKNLFLHNNHFELSF